MNKSFYPKLAINNIKKNGKTYIPYILTSIFTVMMFYILHSISIDKGLDGPNGSESLKIILKLGVICAAIFSSIFLFYTNSFLIKRRKKELGLYNILGLEKKHIAKVLYYETMIIACISIVFGVVLGVILYKAMFLLLLKLLDFPVLFGFYISIPSLLITLVLFLFIFLIILFSNLLQIKISKPIELLKGGEIGEKEPKSKWGLTILGVFTTGIGYYIALSVDTPLAAINKFFIAVILVMIGTYSLFTAGSIFFLKLLKKNVRFYYKTKNFISVSSLIYRMKQNAVGLANICILSTGVLVMLSTTISMYVGVEDALRSRFPSDIVITGDITASEASKTNNLLNTKLEEEDISFYNKFNYWNNSFISYKVDGKYELVDKIKETEGLYLLNFISVSDFNRLEDRNIKLEDNELIIFSENKTFEKDKITINDKTFTVKEELGELVLTKKSAISIANTYILIVNDIEVLNAPSETNYIIAFDVDGVDEDIIKFTNELRNELTNNEINVNIQSIASNREGFYHIYGGLFFLGIFLGTMFLMATVLIIYYKQISEGYDDKERFKILQKVGIDNFDIKKTIKRQVLLIFFLPLIFTVIHIGFGFPIIVKLLAILNLENVPLFLITTLITIIVFAIVYTVVFTLTAKSYYKIVNY